MVLILSSIATLLASVGFIHGETEFGDSDTVQGFWTKVSTLLITSLTTLVSGYIQIEGSKWKEQLQEIEQYKDGAAKLMRTFDENLTVPLQDRLPYCEFQKTVKQHRASMPGRLDFSPEMRNRAIASIKRRDPSVWKRGFIFLEQRGSSCFGRWFPWCCGSVSLGEPVGEAFDWALMRFSGEDMGEYTTRPEVFKQDKADAKKGLYLLAKQSGESITTNIDDLESGEHSGARPHRRQQVCPQPQAAEGLGGSQGSS